MDQTIRQFCTLAKSRNTRPIIGKTFGIREEQWTHVKHTLTPGQFKLLRTSVQQLVEDPKYKTARLYAMDYDNMEIAYGEVCRDGHIDPNETEFTVRIPIQSKPIQTYHQAYDLSFENPTFIK